MICVMRCSSLLQGDLGFVLWPTEQTSQTLFPSASWRMMEESSSHAACIAFKGAESVA